MHGGGKVISIIDYAGREGRNPAFAKGDVMARNDLQYTLRPRSNSGAYTWVVFDDDCVKVLASGTEPSEEIAKAAAEDAATQIVNERARRVGVAT
jgi:hypothetical protein